MRKGPVVNYQNPFPDGSRFFASHCMKGGIMRSHISKLAAGLLVLSILGILGTGSVEAAVTNTGALPLKSADVKATEAPSVQLPVEQTAINVPLPSEELALGYGYFGRYYGGYGYGYYPGGIGLGFGYRSYPYRSFGLGYYGSYYPGYSFYPSSYYYPGSYYSYAYRPSFYGSYYYRPSLYSSLYYRPSYYSSFYSYPYYGSSFYGSYLYGPSYYGGYGYGLYGGYGCGY